MRKIDYLIIYEVYQRELENILLIKLELEKRGYTVAIERRPFRNISALRRKYYKKVKCVLVPTVYSEDVIYSVYLIAGKVDRIFNLQWEQVSSFAGEAGRTGGRSIYPQGICRGTNQLCWGEKPVENLINSGMDTQRCIIVGPIHMDFLRDEFSNYYLDRSDICHKYGFDPKKRIVIFISSFSLTAAPADLKKYLSDVVGKSYIEDFAEISIRSQNDILRWFDLYLKDNNDVEFVYRPHPTEFNTPLLMELDGKYSNFHIISDYSVKQWILISDIILTWYSTSCAEAYFANKPFHILRPYEIPHERELTILDGAKFINTYDEMVVHIEKGGDIPIDGVLLKKYYSFDSLKPSFVRLVDAISNNYSSTPKMNWHHTSYKRFRNKAFLEVPKQYVMPLYIKILEKSELLNKKYGTRFFVNRIDRYTGMKQSTNKIFDKDTKNWEDRIPIITAKLQEVFYGTK